MTAIITLTTDFGTADGYVGAMKGRILSLNPDVMIVDITHEIEPQGVRQAAWCLRRATTTFPDETVHVVVVDPGVGSGRDAVLLRSGDQWFIGPDNGVFSEIVRTTGIQQGFRLHNETRWWKKHSSFDGLALFAPAAACLVNKTDPEKMGEPSLDFVLLDRSQAIYEDGVVSGEIMLFDRFGNAITNIHESSLEQMHRKPVSADAANRRFAIVDHYQEGSGSEGVAIVNSDGYLELSVYTGSARDRLNLKIGDRVLLQ